METRRYIFAVKKERKNVVDKKLDTSESENFSNFIINRRCLQQQHYLQGCSKSLKKCNVSLLFRDKMFLLDKMPYRKLFKNCHIFLPK